MTRRKDAADARRDPGSPELPVEPLGPARWDAAEARLLAELARIDLREAAVEPDPIPPAAAAADDDDDVPASGATRPSARPSRAPRRTRTLVLGAGTLGIAAAAAIALVIFAPPPFGSGAPAARTDSGGTPGPGSPGTTAREGVDGRLAVERLVAENGRPVTRRLGDVALRLAAGTALVAAGDPSRGWLLVLEDGSVRVEVPERRDRPPLEVQAGPVRVQVVGTVFAVSREAASGRVRVHVDEGRVRVGNQAAGERHLLLPGQSYDTDGAGASTTAPPPTDPGSEAARGARQGPAGVAPSGSVAAPAPASRDQSRFEAASRLEARQPDRALAAYRGLARGDGPWAANALYAAGRLAAEEGRSSLARRLLARYLRRFPAGPNAADARAVLDRVRQESTSSAAPDDPGTRR
jgi:ferric-dicitrate binding protein FerR (iron transport regulator)